MSDSAGEESRPGEVDLRRFTPRDLSRILEIERASFPQDPYPDSLFLLLARRQPDLFLVAEHGGTVVGYAVGGVESRSSGRIVSIAVAPRWRRKGIGRQLATGLVTRMEAVDLRRIVLETRVDNEPALALWSQLGFEAAGILPSYYGDGTDAWLMIRSLR